MRLYQCHRHCRSQLRQMLQLPPMRGATDLHLSYPGTQSVDPYCLPHLVPRSNRKHPAVIPKKGITRLREGRSGLLGNRKVQRRRGKGFRGGWIVEEVQVLSCALFLRDASSALFGKEETDVRDPQHQIPLGSDATGPVCKKFTNSRPFLTTKSRRILHVLLKCRHPQDMRGLKVALRGVVDASKAQ